MVSRGLIWVGSGSHDKSGGTPPEGPFRSSDYRELYRFLLHHLPAQEVEDVLQETYRQFLEMAPKVLVRNPRAYIHSIAWHVVCDFRTRRKHQKVNFDSEKMEHAAEHPPDPAIDPISNQLAAVQQLQLALEPLSPTQRAVLLLDRGQGYSRAEIAGKIGLTPNTIKKYTTKALQLIRGKKLTRPGSDTT
jgi:RNA polymerase sigma factor (sigma-70 family)